MSDFMFFIDFDDLGDFRPGLDAAKKKNIVSPLVKCKINKNEVRQIAKLIGLPNWDKPAQPCLSSRVPYGIRISMDSLKRIERSENFLSDLGFLNFRVRIHGDLAKIEVSEDDFVKFSKETSLSIWEETVDANSRSQTYFAPKITLCAPSPTPSCSFCENTFCEIEFCH